MSGWKLGDPGFVAAMKTADRLGADNARLRALIKDAEFSNMNQALVGACPWCQADGYHYAKSATCATDCPAFTPEGAVR